MADDKGPGLRQLRPQTDIIPVTGRAAGGRRHVSIAILTVLNVHTVVLWQWVSIR